MQDMELRFACLQLAQSLVVAGRIPEDLIVQTAQSFVDFAYNIAPPAEPEE